VAIRRTVAYAGQQAMRFSCIWVFHSARS
jgi:hypothetical protein